LRYGVSDLLDAIERDPGSPADRYSQTGQAVNHRPGRDGDDHVVAITEASFSGSGTRWYRPNIERKHHVTWR
jgi:hypothetical protein